MSFMNALGVILITGISGIICFGMVTIAYEDWYHLPNDIGAGFLVVFNGIAGGIACCIVGGFVWAVAGPGFVKPLAWSIGLVVGGGCSVASLLYLNSNYYPVPTISGEKLLFELEVRFPTGQAAPAGEFEYKLTEMIGGKEYDLRLGEVYIENARVENDSWIVPSSVELFTSCPDRTACFSLDERELVAFPIALPGHPRKKHLEWTPWRQNDQNSSADNSFEYRFRVSRIPEPVVLTAEEYEARAEASEQAKFEEILLDAPLDAWFPYIDLHVPSHRRLKAIENIISKPNYITELSALMLTDGPYDEAPRTAGSALRAVARIEKPDVELIPSVVAAGQDIIVRIKEFNKTTPEEDPSFYGAADIDLRFSGWIDAAIQLQKLEMHDFRAQLHEIVELARIREDSIALQGDVVRIGTFYLNRWNEGKGTP